MKNNIVQEIQSATLLSKLQSYKSGYRISSPANDATVGDLILAIVNEDSFLIGTVIKNNFPFFKVKIKHQLGETYHNNDNNNIYVNYWEIYEVIDAI